MTRTRTHIGAILLAVTMAVAMVGPAAGAQLKATEHNAQLSDRDVTTDWTEQEITAHSGNTPRQAALKSKQRAVQVNDRKTVQPRERQSVSILREEGGEESSVFSMQQAFAADYPISSPMEGADYPISSPMEGADYPISSPMEGADYPLSSPMEGADYPISSPMSMTDGIWVFAPDDKPDWMPLEITKGNVSKQGVEHLDEI